MRVRPKLGCKSSPLIAARAEVLRSPHSALLPALRWICAPLFQMSGFKPAARLCLEKNVKRPS